MKKLVLLFVILAMLLAACHDVPVNPTVPGESMPTPTQTAPAPTETDPVPTDPVPTEPAPTEPDPPARQHLTPAELNQLTALFRDYLGFYAAALTCYYDSPQELSLYEFFYIGFRGEPSLTEQEWERLSEVAHYKPYLDTSRLPVKKMEETLQKYFGVSLADMHPDSFERLIYLEQTDCYYLNRGDSNSILEFSVIDNEVWEDGTIVLTYTHRDAYSLAQVGLKRAGDDYRILFNRLLPAVTLSDEISKGVADYWSTRSAYLSGRLKSMNWSVVGINSNEAAHLAKLSDSGIQYDGSRYIMEQVLTNDEFVEVTVVEIFAYMKDGVCSSESVRHVLTLYYAQDGTPVVGADSYAEQCSGYTSRYYPSPALLL